jgi:RNA polymerase sigma-70 factor (ECF subfamily)
VDSAATTFTRKRLVAVRDRSSDVAPQAFAEQLLEHQHEAYSLALRFLRSREAAEDVTQDALIRAYQARNRFRGGSLRAWLLRITANAAIDELRRARRRRLRSLDAIGGREDGRQWLEVADPSPSAEALAANSELRVQLEHALGQLSPDLRMVVLLSDVHGMSYAEVATGAGVPLGTVKSRLSRARARLRDLLRASGTLPVTAGP